MANSVDSDQTPRSAASDLGLHSLLRHVFPNAWSKYGSLSKWNPLRNNPGSAPVWVSVQKAKKIYSLCHSANFIVWDTTWENVPYDMCAQRRLKSACAFAQSDQSLRCSHEETLYPWLSKICSRKILIRFSECPCSNFFFGGGGLFFFFFFLLFRHSDLAVWSEKYGFIFS